VTSITAAHTWFPPELLWDDERFVVYGGYTMVLLRYMTQATNKPYLATLCGPSGRNVLEESPVDHLHHRGVWWGHGDINDVDFYLELPGGEGPVDRGRIEHVAWSKILDEAPRFGFVEDLEWRDHRDLLLMREQRSLTLTLGTNDYYTVDLRSVYTAERDLAFGDTKESVMPGIRPAEALTGLGGGTVVNSRGQTGETAAFGQPAEWVDVSGRRRMQYLGTELTEGIACFDHPSNPGHPQRWFVRDYGPISPFEGHYFHEDRNLGAGRDLRLRHRIVVHLGDPGAADLESLYQAYCEEDSNA
jgi:hypothetical protein